MLVPWTWDSTSTTCSANCWTPRRPARTTPVRSPSASSPGLDSAARLVLLDVLSAAAGEITRDLAPGSVDLRLRGREVEFVVTQTSTESDSDDEPATSVDLDDVSTSRTTLRLPDALKAKVDEAAVADGLSVNTWLVRAVAAALQPKQRRAAQRTLRTGDSFAGWAR